ncbi:hypothetical protein [Alkalihalophilus marmarensis]|uniref:hypothetical protein n=1 Tax=Alkalihalophilus marmarensis TaxID=521377 RepID=UPI002DBCCA81|nr:hypothetical protein [Alkalihalophilus marmarensis]MEC2072904.1 hypothetical protein [Alkalihalophilus marmarensis]
MLVFNVITQSETLAVLNSIGENIFIADNDFQLVWMNNSAHQLLEEIKDDIHISNSHDVLGKNLSIFHRNFNHQQHILTHHLPYQTKIKLYGKYSALLKVTRLKNEKNEEVGYILTWDDVTAAEEENERQMSLLEQLSTPILPMAVDDSLLVPLIGTYDSKRFDLLQQKLLNECAKLGIEYVVFDFSAMIVEDHDLVVSQIATISETVSLIGAEPIYVGFQIPLIKNLVAQKVKPEAKIYGSFKQASTYLLKKTGYLSS